MLDTNVRSATTIDLPLLTVKERLATSGVKCDLLVLFGRNPQESYSPAEAALLIRRPRAAVSVELQDLQLLGALVACQGDGEPRYRLTGDSSLQALIVRFAVSDLAAGAAPRARFAA